MARLVMGRRDLVKSWTLAEQVEQINDYVVEGSAIAGSAVAAVGERVVLAWSQGGRLGLVVADEHGARAAAPVWIHQGSRALAAPALAVAPGGDLILLCQADRLQLRRSGDGGLSWSSPQDPHVPPGSFAFAGQRLLATDDGRLLLGVVDGQGRAGLLCSDDGGRHWRFRSLIVPDSQSRRCGMPALYHRPGGVGMILAVHGDAQVYTFHSDDAGEQWSLFDNSAPPARAEFPFAVAATAQRDQHFMLWHNHSIATNLTCCRRREGERFWDCFHELEPQDRWPDPCLFLHPAMALAGDWAHVSYVEHQPPAPDRVVYRRLPLSELGRRQPRRAMVNDCETYMRQLLSAKQVGRSNAQPVVSGSFNPGALGEPS
jgi:hypothetical protein